ncbi:cytochrome b/b6 domain-containing protein [Methylocystis bryophila]|uniref:Thioredoxin reductase n=1 Tax=Methylocystis bryophila TaxID=655015 RepID=A0A1W6MYW5_9HYPH|nr:cytochrome b/b6 domain-containing protein [Methylocystis bryophila]ARN82765.1 thioredoxin reductase [Methylocystis bryophila]
MSQSQDREAGGEAKGHALFVRVTHWINALAVFIMIGSGWRIYDASPLFNFRFPPDLTIGGWLAGALAWHFAAMWLLVANGVAYLAYGFVSGRFWRGLPRIPPSSAYRDPRPSWATLTRHEIGAYNPVQRVLYTGVVALLILLVASGVAVWKPVQFQHLAALFGGYEGARHAHFYAMAALCAFIALHVTLAFFADGVLRSMITGRPPTAAASGE